METDDAWEEFVNTSRRPLLVSSLRYLPDLVESREEERETNG